MNNINKVSLIFMIMAIFGCISIKAQDKIVHPDISYAGTPRTVTIGGINVSGVEGYEDYILSGISGLSVGQKIEIPGMDITNAVKRYWKHGLFSKVQISVDSLIGDKAFLHIACKCVRVYPPSTG
jgi:outer membrane protein insertion porin family